MNVCLIGEWGYLLVGFFVGVRHVEVNITDRKAVSRYRVVQETALDDSRRGIEGGGV